METENNHLGPIGVATSSPSAFVGYVFIPGGVSRDTYVAHCFTTNTVTLITERSEIYQRVPISDSCLQQLIFPRDTSVTGSPVVCVTIPVHDQPVIVAVLRFADDAPSTTKERSIHRMLLGVDTSFAFHADGDLGTFSVVANGKKNISSVKLLSPDTDSKLDVYVQGNIGVEADALISILTQEGFSLTIGPADKSKILQLLQSKGLTYVDDYKNDISITEDGLHYKFQGKAEKSMLGESSTDWLNTFGELMATLTVSTVFGPSGPPINVLKIKQHLTKLPGLLSNKFSHP